MRGGLLWGVWGWCPQRRLSGLSAGPLFPRVLFRVGAVGFLFPQQLFFVVPSPLPPPPPPKKKKRKKKESHTKTDI